MRLAYLMKQSEVFAHFLSGGSTANDSNHTRSGKSSGKRSKMTEESEDKELMQLATSNKAIITRLTNQPFSITGGTMKSYQLEGLNWLIKLHDNNINGILADEMGLGKTLQTISLLAYLKESRKISGPHVIIVPKSTVSNWMREINRWCPSFRAIKLLGDGEERKRVCTTELILGKFDIVVTSYESILKEVKYIRKIKWRYVIIDEAHRIKNENSLLSVVVRTLKTDFKLLITGTPLQNNLHELWALLNFLLPEVFDDCESFDSWFNTESSQAKENVIKRLHAVLKPFMLRRVKMDVEKDIPPKKETKLYIGLSTLQRSWYTKLLAKDFDAINAIGKPERTRLLNMLMQLRKVCNHPYLFEGAEPGPPYMDGPHIWQNCGKMVLLDKLLPKLKAQGSRVLIFSQMTRMLDILEDYLRYHNYKYCRIDGSTSGEDRDVQMDAFNRPKSDKFVFILSTRAGGLGINLQTADTVILYDSDWNPQVDLQAMDRAHRIGQTKEVRVFRFVTEGSVEEKIIERADRKLFLDAAVIQQGRLAEKHSQLSKGELLTMVRFGADAIMASKDGTLTDEDINVLLARGEEKTQATSSNLATEMKHNLANFSIALEENQEINLFTFEGENWRNKAASRSDLPKLEFISLPQRERKQTYNVNDYYKNALSTSGAAARGPPKPSRRKIQYPEYQFFNKARLVAIADHEFALTQQKNAHIAMIKDLKLKDIRLRRKLHRLRLKESSGTQQEEDDDDGNDDDDKPADNNDDPSGKEKRNLDEQNDPEFHKLTEFGEDAEAYQAIVDSGKFDLPENIAKEKKALEEQGFSYISRKDFFTFVSYLETYGKSDRPGLHKDVSAATGKTEIEIEKYANVFFKRYQELSNYSAITDKIEKGDRRVLRSKEIRDAIDAKVQRHAANSTPLTVVYGMQKGHLFSEEEDAFLILMLHKHGYGSFDQIRAEILKAPEFLFDWFIKSRTIAEIQRRCDVLVRIIEKENNEYKSGKKRGIADTFEGEDEPVIDEEAAVKKKKGKK